jgi:dihydrofolate reductase
MRKVVSGLFMSLDGVAESPDQWQFDHFDEGMMAALGEHLATTDAVMLGRVTYQEWAGYWPNSTDEPFASYINNAPKYVVSNTLDHADWQNTTLIKGADLATTLAQLKQQPGKNIAVTGSPTLVYSLLRDNLLDELTMMIHPVVAGKGKRLFPDNAVLQRLQLTNSTITPTGVALLTYQRREA